jgi:hypothetical protein
MLKKILLKPGVNKENTRYTNENGWYISDKVRFRQGTPEKIGGWNRISDDSFLGICRNLWNWVTLGFLNLMGVGTNLKYYVEQDGVYYDITPIRETVTLTNPFTATLNSSTITVADTAHGCLTGDFVTFSGGGVTGLGGNVTASVLKQEFQVTVSGPNAYTISIAPVVANATDVSGSPGGGTVTAAYQINTGPAIQVPLTGWGSGFYGFGSWGTGSTQTDSLRLWSANNWGEDLIFGPRGGALYYWDATNGVTTRGVALNSLGGTVTLTIATPCVITLSNVLAEGTAIKLATTGALPTGLTAGTTYYLRNVDGLTANLSASPAGALISTVSTNTINNNPFALTASTTVTVTDTSHGQSTGALVTFSGAVDIGGAGTNVTAAILNQQFTITVTGVNTYTITLSVTPNATAIAASPGGGAAVVATYQSGTQSISTLVDVPTYQNIIFVSDTSRFVLVFGTNEIGSAVLDPMLVRWGDQESVTDWYPSATNQAGSLRLSHGSKIVAVQQTRQEILTWTDSSLYSLQYLGPPYVWGSQLLGDNISIVSPNATAIASGRSYWMGVDKFYVYDGRVQTLRCDLRRHVFSNINAQQNEQIFAGTNEGFNEVWWFYCSAGVTEVDSYVVYNYVEDIWYYGSLARTAWIDSGLRDYPVAATYSYNLVNHEEGIDDNETGTPTAITAYIESAEFDIEDGQNFGFVWRMVPDLTFEGSTANAPQVTMTMYGMNGSGSGFQMQTGKNVTRTSTATIEQFTNIIYTRIRGRQMIMKIESDQLGCTWQLGAPRIDIRADGER